MDNPDNPHLYPLTKTHMVLLTVSINQGSKGNQAENEISFVWNLPARRGSGIQLSSKKKTSTITYALTGVGDIIYVAKGDNYFNPTCFAFMAMLLEQQGDQSGLNFWGVLLMAAKK